MNVTQLCTNAWRRSISRRGWRASAAAMSCVDWSTTCCACSHRFSRRGEGHYHCAVWAWQANEREQSRTARARALSIFEQHGDIAGIANCRDLEALAERLAGNLQHAAELYKINRDLPSRRALRPSIA